MKWFLLYQGILLMILVASALQELVIIHQITLSDDPNGGLEFCWTDNSVVYQKAELTVLLNPGGVTQTPIEGSVIDNKCALFINDPALTVNPTDALAFALRLFKSAANTKPAPDAEGFITMVWPDVTECQSADSVNTSNTVFRFQCDADITGSEDKLFIDDSLIDCSSTSNAVYVTYCFLDIAPTTLIKFKICQVVEANVNEVTADVDLCAAPISINPFNGKDSVITSLQLDYTNKITSSDVTPETDTVTFDIINYWEGLTGDTKYSVLCTIDASSSLGCSTEGYVPGRKDMNILLVGYDSSSPPIIKESNTAVIQDLDLKGEFVLDKTIEIRWQLPGTEDATFRAQIENCVDGSTPMEDMPFVDADVLCSAAASMCYAYFIEIPQGTTSCDTIIDTIAAKAVPTNMNRIKTTVTSSSKRRNKKELQIHTVQATWNEGDAEAKVRVCFNHNSSAADTEFSQYEFVVVNNKGQWLKHKLMTQDTTGDICFSTFSINTETFHVSEGATLVLTQRAQDGITVLAGGEAKILFSRDL